MRRLAAFRFVQVRSDPVLRGSHRVVWQPLAVHPGSVRIALVGLIRGAVAFDCPEVFVFVVSRIGSSRLCHGFPSLSRLSRWPPTASAADMKRKARHIISRIWNAP